MRRKTRPLPDLGRTRRIRGSLQTLQDYGCELLLGGVDVSSVVEVADIAQCRFEDSDVWQA